MKGYSQKYICEDYISNEDYKITRNARFYILRQAVSEGCSSKGYASFKQVEPWSWHIEVIPGVSNSGTGRQAHFTDCP